MPYFDLLLSGGGFRAALFHLGILRFLYECEGSTEESKNALEEVRTVVGVSGGSMTAAHFLLNRPTYTHSFVHATQDLIDFVQTVDLRRELLTKRKPLSATVSSIFPSGKLLSDLSSGKTHATLLGTDLSTGGCVAFNSDGITLLESGEEEQWLLAEQARIASPDVDVSYAVQASAAFPPFLQPLRIDRTIFHGNVSNASISALDGHDVADGGIRDNIGIEWYRSRERKTGDTETIVCDAGQRFDWVAVSHQHQSLQVWVARLLRCIDIQMHRISYLDLREAADATKIQIFDTTHHSPHADDAKSLHSQPLTKPVASKIAALTTDLTKLSKAEVYAVTRLGYDLASRTLSRNHSLSVREDAHADEFWEKLFPEGITSFNATGKNAATSLEHAIDTDRKPWLAGFGDLWRHLPLTVWQRCSAVALLLIILAFLTVGVAQSGRWVYAHGREWIDLAVPRDISSSDFRKRVLQDGLEDAAAWAASTGRYLQISGNHAGGSLRSENLELTVPLGEDEFRVIAIFNEASDADLPADPIWVRGQLKDFTESTLFLQQAEIVPREERL